MGRPSEKTPTERTQIVLSVLRGEHSIAEAARGLGISEQALGNWKRQFLAGGAEAMNTGGTKTSSRGEQPAYENEELKTALGEARVELRVWGKVPAPEYSLPIEDLEMVPYRRIDAHFEVRSPDWGATPYLLTPAR